MVGQYVARPPVRSKQKPVLNEASGLTIHAAVDATSSIVPQLHIEWSDACMVSYVHMGA